jgi:hypothetical protein
MAAERGFMGERKLEVVTEIDRRVFWYDHSSSGYAMKFVSGPAGVSLPEPGAWLDRWEARDGKRRFGFGPNPIVFTNREDAEHVQVELKRAVDFITAVVG